MGTEFRGKGLRLTPPLPLGVVLMSRPRQPCQDPHPAQLLLPQVETPWLPSLSTCPRRSLAGLCLQELGPLPARAHPMSAQRAPLPPCLLLWLASPLSVLPQGLTQLQAYSKCSVTVDSIDTCFL